MKSIHLAFFVRLIVAAAMVLGSLSFTPTYSQPAQAAFTTGNVVVYRVGDGTSSLSNTGNAAFLVEYSPDGALVDTVALPVADAAPNQTLIASGTQAEGFINLSTDGKYLVVAGYDSPSLPYPSALAGSPGATVQRTVALVDGNGVVNTVSTFSDFASGGNARSAASPNGTDLYMGGSTNGVRYGTAGTTNTTSTQLATTTTNIRAVGIFDGQLYFSASSGAIRLATLGTGLPTTADQVITNLPGFPTATGSPYGFFFADLDAGVAGVDTLYVADDSSAVNGGGLQKYSLVGGLWTLNSTSVTVEGSDAFRGVTGVVTGNTVTLFATGATKLVKVVDTAGYNAANNGVPATLITAGTNTAFRGVAMAPTPPTTTKPDLTLSLSVPLAVDPNVDFDVTLTARNTGTVAASGITVELPVAAELVYQSSSATVGSGFTGSFAAGKLTFTGGSLAAGASATLTGTFRSSTLGVYAFAAGAGSIDPANTVDEDDETNNGSNAASLEIKVTSQCNLAFTSIAAIQGTLDTPALTGVISTQGFVTAKLGDASGYYLESAMDDMDADPLTSEGLYIFGANSGVTVGDYVRISGTLSEFQRGTQTGTPSYFEKCPTTGKTFPTPVTVDLTQVNSDTYLERYENMLVDITGPLTVQQNYFQGRYGQVTLAAGGRLFGKTNGGTATDYYRMIVLDDWFSSQNKNPIAYYAADGALRAGDTLTGVTGVLNQGAINSTTTPAVFPYNWYRVQPTSAPVFTSANPRPQTPPAVGGTLKVGAFNVENYFTTLDIAPYTAPYGSNTPRGADSAAEFTRQKTKIVEGLKAINADVFGLMEIESLNSAQALKDLVDTLNASIGAPTYDYIVDSVPDPDGSAGGYDYIQVALIYKPATVTPVGAAMIDLNPIFDRVPLAQTFESVANGETFTVLVNHYKSKGSCPTAAADPDNIDLGQGCWSAKRVLQAQATLEFINTQLLPVDPDVLVIGDLNAYSNEDPITTLENGGLVDQVEANVPFAERYSYIFDGASGYLDHMLSTSSVVAQVSDAAYWHINADEPTVIDFNTEFKNYGAETRYSPDLYQPNPFRSSDHDPVYIGLNLVNQAPTVTNPLVDQHATQDASFSYTFAADSFADVEAGSTLTYSAKQANGSPLPAWLSFDPATRTFSGKPTFADIGVKTIRVTATDDGAIPASVYDDFTLTVANVNDAPIVNKPVANQVTWINQAYNLNLPIDTFIDPDSNDTLRYWATLADGRPLPAWLLFDAFTRSFSGTPGFSGWGVYQVKVYAADPSGAVASLTFTLQVKGSIVMPIIINNP